MGPLSINNYKTDFRHDTYNAYMRTTYENHLDRIYKTNRINDRLKNYFNITLNNTYKFQYEDDSKKNKNNHILITLFIMCIIVLIVIFSKDTNYYLLFLSIPIIIIGYISYNIFKRILEKKYTEKQNKRVQILQNINDKYNNSNRYDFSNDDKNTIHNTLNYSVNYRLKD